MLEVCEGIGVATWKFFFYLEEEQNGKRKIKKIIIRGTDDCTNLLPSRTATVGPFLGTYSDNILLAEARKRSKACYSG
jgi:hypothetical protein